MPRDTWRTPPVIYEVLNAKYGPFTIDLAADGANHLCPRWYGPGSPLAEDALGVTWAHGHRGFCNPPYSRGNIGLFLRKAHLEVGLCRATFLLPADTSTAWWHDYVYYQGRRPYAGVEVEFLRGRITFLEPTGEPGPGSPPFPSVVVTIGA